MCQVQHTEFRVQSESKKKTITVLTDNSSIRSLHSLPPPNTTVLSRSAVYSLSPRPLPCFQC